MTTQENIIAGIVLYNPDVKRLRQNVHAILPQVNKLILIDNGSADLSYLEEYNQEIFEIKCNNENKGIAFALNEICEFADRNNYDWVLTLDQDSIVAEDMVSVYCKYAEPAFGILHCKVIDRNFTRKAIVESNSPIEEIVTCITSGSLTNIKAWKDCGGFDNKMFIDCVDWDFCYSLRKYGYKIMRTNQTSILHELGSKSQAKYIGKHEFLITNHSEIRNYYKFRNYIYISRKFEELSICRHLLICLRWSILTILFSTNKLSVLKSQWRGVKDGFIMNID